MSFAAMAWAMDAGVGGSDFNILMQVANCIDPETGVCWPSVGYLAEKAQLSVRATQDALRRLEALGAITTEPRANKGFRSSNLYRMPQVGGGADFAGGSARFAGRGAASRTTAPQPAAPQPRSQPHHIRGSDTATDTASEPSVSSGEETTSARNDDSKGELNLVATHNGNGSDSSAPARARLHARVSGATLRIMTDAWNSNCHAMQQSMAKPPEPSSPRGRSMLAFWHALDAAAPEGVTAADLWVRSVQAFAADPFWNRTGKTADRADPFSVDHLVRANQRDARVERVATALRAPVRPAAAAGLPEWFRPMQRPLEGAAAPFPGIPASAEGLAPL